MTKVERWLWHGGHATKWVLEDFREAENLYEDYQEVEGFTDEEYAEMLKALRRLADQPE